MVIKVVLAFGGWRQTIRLVVHEKMRNVVEGWLLAQSARS
jgi:hypothetical protein